MAKLHKGEYFLFLVFSFFLQQSTIENNVLNMGERKEGANLIVVMG